MEILVNNIRMYYAERGEGLPVILLHGFPLDHTIWEATLVEMQADARLITPDLRGFGRSEAPKGSYTMGQMADDVAALMDGLGLPGAVVVGHSMAGYVALEFARSHPDRLAGLGLVCTQALADAPDRRAARYTQAEELLERGPKELATSMTPRLSADHQYHAEIYRIILRNPAVGLAGALQAMAERDDKSELLPAITVPSVVITGLDDQLTPPDRSREMAVVLPRCELVEIAGAGHMPMLEKPRETASALDRLILEVENIP